MRGNATPRTPSHFATIAALATRIATTAARAAHAASTLATTSFATTFPSLLANGLV